MSVFPVDPESSLTSLRVHPSMRTDLNSTSRWDPDHDFLIPHRREWFNSSTFQYLSEMLFSRCLLLFPFFHFPLSHLSFWHMPCPYLKPKVDYNHHTSDSLWNAVEMYLGTALDMGYLGEGKRLGFDPLLCTSEAFEHGLKQLGQLVELHRFLVWLSGSQSLFPEALFHLLLTLDIQLLRTFHISLSQPILQCEPGISWGCSASTLSSYLISSSWL